MERGIVFVRTSANSRGSQKHSADFTSTSDDPQQDNHNRDHQQNMNETAHGVRRDQSQQPQDKHYYGNGIKHFLHLSVS
jgi:hypothetical protein